MTRRILAAGFLAAVGLAVLSAAQAEKPPSEEAYRANNLGVAYLEQHDYATAVAQFQRALKASPALAIARLNLAIALFYNGELDQARREAEISRAALRSPPHPHYLLGLIAREADRPAEALTHFQQVRRLDPDDVGTAISIGQIHLQEGRYGEARDAFSVATVAEPYNSTAAYGLATAMLRGGARDEGSAAMQKFQQLQASAYAVTYSRNYLEQGRYAEAIASTGAEPDLVDERVPETTFRVVAASPVLERTAGVTLADYDRDGDLDLLAGHADGLVLLRNEGGRFIDVTDESGLGQAPATSALAGDYDNDGLTDLCLLSDGGVALFRQEAGGRFTRAPAQGLAYAHPAATAAWLDVDHDGDVDLFVGGAGTAASARLFRNNGNGTFADITATAKLAFTGTVAAAVATDHDNRRDIDLLITPAAGRPLLMRNLRDGTFEDVAAAVGLAVSEGTSAIAAGDVNKDSLTDFFFASGERAVLALSTGRGGFNTSTAIEQVHGARAALLLDYDNDGLLDLVATTSDGIRVLRNVGSRFMDVSDPAVTAPPGIGTVSSLAAGDIDGDGDVDLVTGGTRLLVWRNDGGSHRHSLTVRLSARVSNRSAVGAKVEIRAGSLFQKLEVYASSPSAAPADLVFGLGNRPGVDVARVLWPAGILQAEIGTAPQADPGPNRAATLLIEELDRKPSSCPYLYTWNGERFEFITDFLGGGEMGYWLAPGLRNTPDPDEYVRIDGTKLAPREGRYELRVTNELEEALFLDRAQLVAVDHPADVEVHPAEGMRAAPRPFELYFATGPTAPSAAVDDHGHDVRDRVLVLDRRYPDDFALHRIRGYAAPHSLTLTLPPGERRLLLLTGWTDYAFSGDNVAAHQAGLALVPPSLEWKGSDGRWRVAIENIGFPVGRPQTMVVDLGAVPAAVREVRISTSMRVYWDRIQVAEAGAPQGTVVTHLAPASADLRWRGFSAEVTPDGREPYSYDYGRVSTVSPWKHLPGRYTREGDVRELLMNTDDMFVVARTGDAIALAFAAGAVPPLPDGWQRTFLLYADGFSKEMDLNSSSPDQVAPLPFHGMRGYPYEADDAYPASDVHRLYVERYNTRIVPRAVPPLELSAGVKDR